jgi:hypothetical protein
MKRISLIAVAWVLVLSTACANHQKKIDEYRAAYQSDTQILNKIIEPMGIEPSHGQVTLTVAQSFAQKIVLSSLHPNLMTVSVQEKGRVWKGEGEKLHIKYDNGVWLNQGTVQLKLNANSLVLDGDTISLQTTVDGAGAINADLKFFGVNLNRDVELQVHHDEPMHLKLEADQGGWIMRAVGQPLHADVNVKTPALKVAGVNVYDLKMNRTIEVPLEKIKPYSLPLPAPRTVKVGADQIQVGLTNYKLGAHAGLLWLGADLLVGDAPPEPAAEPLGPQAPKDLQMGPAPAAEPLGPPAPTPAPTEPAKPQT